jgi:hypothetical protein
LSDSDTCCAGGLLQEGRAVALRRKVWSRTAAQASAAMAITGTGTAR